MKVKTSLILVNFFSIWLGTFQVLAQERLIVASTERPPYIGPDLDQQGYVHELISKIFQRMGYQLEIEYFPLPRARIMAAEGKFLGMVPAYRDSMRESEFSFSDPFPGDHFGLLKHRSFDAELGANPKVDLSKALATLRNNVFGLTRGNDFEFVLDRVGTFRKEYAGQDLHNIDKLAAGRIDLAVIDKYSAAHIMVNYRPNLIGQLEFLFPPLLNNNFHLAFSRKYPGYLALKTRFNEVLAEMIEDGSLDELLYRHGLFPPRQQDNAKVRLTIATVDNSDMIVMRKLSKEFLKAHPNIELDWRVLSEGTLRRRLLSDLAVSDGHFDIVTIGPYEAPIWAKRGWITPLLNLPESYDVEDILPSVRQVLSQDNELYALPFYAESAMLYYRTDLFAKAGLQMPEQPTFRDILEFAESLHAPDNKIYGICLRGKPGWGENMAVISSMVRAFGGRWFDDQWKPEIRNQAWREAIGTYETLVRRFGPPGARDHGFNENLELFANGHCGMWIDATVAAGLLYNPNKSKVHDRVGYAYVPSLARLEASEVPASNWLWTWALAIPDSSRNKAEALQFITWATSKQYIELVAKHEGWVAAPPGTRRSTYTNPQYRRAAPFADFVLKAIESTEQETSTQKTKLYTGLQYVGIPEFTAVGQQVAYLMVALIEGRMSVDRVLRESESLVLEQMRRSGYYEPFDEGYRESSSE